MASKLKAPLEAIFHGLKGSWNVKRTLSSKLPDFPSGEFVGNATFTPSNAFNKTALLYYERGHLYTDMGLAFPAERKYIYRFNPDDEKISVWFVKDNNGEDDIDYLYHELEFEPKDGRWIARADHLCEQDMYWAFYDFRLDASSTAIEKWGLRHEVKGPSKDYTSDTAYVPNDRND